MPRRPAAAPGYPVGTVQDLDLSGANALVTSPSAGRSGQSTFVTTAAGAPTSYSEISAVEMSDEAGYEPSDVQWLHHAGGQADRAGAGPEHCSRSAAAPGCSRSVTARSRRSASRIRASPAAARPGAGSSETSPEQPGSRPQSLTASRLRASTTTPIHSADSAPSSGAASRARSISTTVPSVSRCSPVTAAVRRRSSRTGVLRRR